VVHRGQISKTRSVAKIIVTTAAAAALTLTATAASALAGNASGPDGSLSGIATLTSVACPTATACVTVGYGGTNDTTGMSAAIDAATGTATAWSGGLDNESLNAVACAAKATTCLAVANDGVATVNVATGAMTLTATPKPPKNGIMAMGAIACASAKICYAVGFQGPFSNSNAIIMRLSGTGKLVKKTINTGTGSAAIWCPTTTRCLLSDYKAPVQSIQVLTNGAVTSSTPLPAGTSLQAIRCYKADLCYALAGNTGSSPEETDQLFPLNPTTGVAGSVITIPDFSGDSLTCISATTCLVVGFTNPGTSAKPAVVAVTSGTLGTPANYPGDSLSSIACATASRCYAVGLGKTSAIVDKVKSDRTGTIGS
jgi:hypothetical protein